MKKYFSKTLVALIGVIIITAFFINNDADIKTEEKIISTDKPYKKSDKKEIKHKKNAKDDLETVYESVNKEAKIEETEYIQDNEAISENVKENNLLSENAQKTYCHLFVSCDSINNDISRLSEEKHFLVPKDGVLLKNVKVEFEAGDSVFDVLLKKLREEGIHLEFTKIPFTESVYIEGIGNIYEFDCGELSGWQYSVNGEFLSVASSEYTLKDGDKIAFLYTCDLGHDIGGYYDKE